MSINNSDLLAALGLTSISFPKVQVLPSAPEIGEVYFNTSNNKTYIFTGSDWELLGNATPSGSGSSTTTIINSIDPLPAQANNAGKVLSTDGTTPSWVDPIEELPAQANNTGKVLSTDGTTPSWIDVPLSPDELPAQANNAGKVLGTDGAAASWIDVPLSPDELPAQANNAGKILSTDGTTPSWVNPIEELPSKTNNAGRVLGTNGAIVSWVDIPQELPPQTGNSGKVLSTDGTTPSWVDPIAAPASVQVYDVAYANPEQLTPSTTLLYFAFPRRTSLPNTFSSSYASAMAVFYPTILSIRKNGVEIGTITFTDGYTQGVFDSTSATNVTFEIGDIISLEAPQETDIIGVSISLGFTLL